MSGLTILQVDDSYDHGDDEFIRAEERESVRFQCKPRRILDKGDSSEFNGCRIHIDRNGTHSITQSEKLRAITEPKTRDELVSARAQVQYIGSCTRPDLCAPVQLMASTVQDPSDKTYSEMRKIIAWCHETSGVGIKYVPLDEESSRLALFTDASFANADRLKSQLGFVLVILDDNNNANIIHYGSSSRKMVERSGMAAELHALTYGFNQAYVAKNMLEEMLGRHLDLDGYVDSRIVFNVVAKNSATLEKSLQIDAHALRESHCNGELRYLAWIPGTQNVSDGLTKGLVGSSHSLWRLITTNKLFIQPQGWVEGPKRNH